MAALSVVAALVAGLLLDRLLETAPFVSLFLCAIMFASWYGGVGPGLFATALSISAFDYYFLPPIHSVAVALRDIPRLALFALTALFVIAMNAAQRTAAQSLRRTRDDLQTAVQQLERVNASLQVENAERRRAESALRRSEAYLAEAQRLSGTGSFGWKIASGEIFWSEETYRILMVDRAIKPTADVILQCVHPDEREFVRREIDRQAQGGQDWDYEHRLLTPDGDVKHLHVRAHRVKYESGDEEIVGALMDVTATRKAQEALHIAQTELAHVTRVTTLGEMSASIAHEVNQPLAAIVTNGEAGLRWLGRGVPEIKEAVDAIRQIVSEAHRASGVIRGIREFSRKAAPEMIQLDINDVLDDCGHPGTARGVSPRSDNAAAPWVAAANGAWRSNPAAAGDHQSGHQCHPSDGDDHRSRAGAVHPHETAWPRPGAGGGGGRRRRNRARQNGSAFQRLLHHEARWLGYGIVDLSFDHRSARRPGVGFSQYWTGDDVSVYDFGLGHGVGKRANVRTAPR